jgi:hypothetical protein
MAEIISFVALPFDFVDGGIAAGEPIDCPSPAAAIQRAQGLWKISGQLVLYRSAALRISRSANSTISMCFADLGT